MYLEILMAALGFGYRGFSDGMGARLNEMVHSMMYVSLIWFVGSMNRWMDNV